MSKSSPNENFAVVNCLNFVWADVLAGPSYLALSNVYASLDYSVWWISPKMVGEVEFLIYINAKLSLRSNSIFAFFSARILSSSSIWQMLLGSVYVVVYNPFNSLAFSIFRPPIVISWALIWRRYESKCCDHNCHFLHYLILVFEEV